MSLVDALDMVMLQLKLHLLFLSLTPATSTCSFGLFRPVENLHKDHLASQIVINDHLKSCSVHDTCTPGENSVPSAKVATVSTTGATTRRMCQNNGSAFRQRGQSVVDIVETIKVEPPPPSWACPSCWPERIYKWHLLLLLLGSVFDLFKR
ncbi:hypothetical protein pipiens_011454 [Culex pipiens pipiens]|uniref:Uncharacterized protein n=1 Tax=Culex pipiens pipiens TaxID=38569 RepID=A0ABD1D682_CULPP